MDSFSTPKGGALGGSLNGQLQHPERLSLGRKSQGTASAPRKAEPWEEVTRDSFSTPKSWVLGGSHNGQLQHPERLSLGRKSQWTASAPQKAEPWKEVSMDSFSTLKGGALVDTGPASPWCNSWARSKLENISYTHFLLLFLQQPTLRKKG